MDWYFMRLSKRGGEELHSVHSEDEAKQLLIDVQGPPSKRRKGLFSANLG